MNLLIAQAGWDFLIYLIVGVFWLIGNIAQQKKAKAKAQEMRQRREEREREERRTGKKTTPHPLESDLEAFLGRLAGEQYQPKPQTRPQAKSTPTRPPPLPKTRTTPEIQFDQAPPPPAPTPVPSTAFPAASNEMDTAFSEIEDMKDAVEISYDNIEETLQETTLQTVKQMRVDLSSMMVELPRLPVQRMRSVHTHTTPPDLKSKESFKKAILSGIILGPPAALQDPSSNAR